MTDRLEEFYQALKHGFYTQNRNLRIRLPDTVEDLIGRFYADTIEHKELRIQRALEEQKEKAVIAKAYERVQKQYVKTGWIQGKTQNCHWRFVLAEKTTNGLKVLEKTAHVFLTPSGRNIIWFKDAEDRGEYVKRIEINNKSIIDGRKNSKYREGHGERWLHQNIPYPWAVVAEFWFWTSTLNLDTINRLIEEKTHEFLTMHGNLPKRHLHLLNWRKQTGNLEACLELRW